jgi:hypothetical protein
LFVEPQNPLTHRQGNGFHALSLPLPHLSVKLHYLWKCSSGSEAFGLAAILGCLTAVKVILFAADIAFVVQGFRVHWGWGTANIFLGPLAGIPFFIQHRHEGRVPVYVLAHGLILLLVIVICLILYKAVA